MNDYKENPNLQVLTDIDCRCIKTEYKPLSSDNRYRGVVNM